MHFSRTSKDSIPCLLHRNPFQTLSHELNLVVCPTQNSNYYLLIIILLLFHISLSVNQFLINPKNFPSIHFLGEMLLEKFIRLVDGRR